MPCVITIQMTQLALIKLVTMCDDDSQDSSCGADFGKSDDECDDDSDDSSFEN